MPEWENVFLVEMLLKSQKFTYFALVFDIIAF